VSLPDLPHHNIALIIEPDNLLGINRRLTMFEHIQKIQGNVLAIKITGEVTESEHDQLDRLIQKAVASWVSIRVFIVIKHYPSFNSAEALYEDLRMVKKHSNKIERLAVVGDRHWKRTWVGLFGLFSGIVTEYFETDQIDTAYRWIKQNG